MLIKMLLIRLTQILPSYSCRRMDKIYMSDSKSTVHKKQLTKLMASWPSGCGVSTVRPQLEQGQEFKRSVSMK